MAINRDEKGPHWQLGEYIGYLRTQHGYAQATVIGLLWKALSNRGISVQDVHLSERAYKRLEAGTLVKLSRDLLEAVASVLCRTPEECATFWLLADRNICVSAPGLKKLGRAQNPDESTLEDALAMLNEVVYILRTEAGDLIKTLMMERGADELSTDEKLEIVLKLLSLIIQRRRRRR